jgi:hypothetical protein
LILWVFCNSLALCCAAEKKKATLDYEELFRSEPKDAWFSGLSALMLEDDPSKPDKAVAGVLSTLLSNTAAGTGHCSAAGAAAATVCMVGVKQSDNQTHAPCACLCPLHIVQA